MLQGHEVSVADNFFTGRKRNVEQWIGHENFELINHDIVNPLFIEVDEVYHLASPASPPHYMFNPVKTIKTNTVGTVNMLGRISSTSIASYFLSSSPLLFCHSLQVMNFPWKLNRTGETRERKNFNCEHIRGVWRPTRASTNRVILGKCQSHWSKSLLWRGETCGRSIGLCLWKTGKCFRSSCSYFQHFWTENAYEWWSSRFQFYCSSSSECIIYCKSKNSICWLVNCLSSIPLLIFADFWKWGSDSIFPIRFRFSRRTHCSHEFKLLATGELGQSWRTHYQR